METKTDVRELLELERQYWQAIKDQDVKTAMRLTDDECIISGAQGFSRLRKNDLEGMMRTSSYRLNRFKIEGDPEVRLVDDGVAVLAYNVHEELTVDGKPVSLDAAESSTWVRRKGQWVCAQHAESILGDPFGRDRKETP